MLFTSYSFFAFFAVFWCLYRYSYINVRWLVIVASLIFYGAWNPFFIGLILLTSTVDYVCARLIARNRSHGKILVAASVTTNLSVLGFFKYGAFAASALTDALALGGVTHPIRVPEIILPIGISFHTFQTMSYTIDVYRNKLPPARTFSDFLLYVSFFPQLIAGPIERAGSILPQIEALDGRRRHIDTDRLYAALSLILRGYLKKVLIADHLATYTDPVYGALDGYGLASVAIATLFFAIQIYCDFSGYTDIARGLAELIGIRLTPNFDYPYFATSIRDFWGRWHMSLSSWFRDYVYIPLGGNRGSHWRTCRNLLVTMLLAGLWHGATYTFLIWGAFYGALLSIHRTWCATLGRRIRIPDLLGTSLTLLCVMIGWVFFRAESISDILGLCRRLGSSDSFPQMIPRLHHLLLAAGFITWQFVERHVIIRRLSLLDIRNEAFRVATALGCAAACFILRPATSGVFIYFQF